MADRYWVGGTGTWDGANTANWSTTSGGSGGASVPTASDDVIFDAGSDAGGSFTCTMVGSRVCKSFSASSLDFGMTLAGAGNSTLTVSGSLSFPATNFTRTYTTTTTFNATTTGNTITTNGVAFGATVVFGGFGGAWTLGSAFSCGTGLFNTLTLLAGTLDTGGYNITCGNFLSPNSSTRTLNLNSSTVNVGGNWNANTTIGLTLNAGTSTINLTGSVSISSIFNGGGLTYYNVAFTTFATGTQSVTGANTFNNLTSNSLTFVGLRNISFDANQTINGTFTVSTSAANNRYFIQSNTFKTQRTLTCAAVSFTNVDFRDTVIAGVAAPATGTRLGNCGNNSGITFTAAANKYWVGASSNDWNNNVWALSLGGAAAANNFPLPQDTAIIDDSALTAGQTVTLNVAYNYPTIDTSARTNVMTLSLSQNSTIVGGFLVGSGVTVSGGYFIFTNDALQQLSGSLPRFEINGFSTGGVQLSGSAAATTQVDLVNGTLDLNGETLTAAFFQILGGTKNVTFNGGTIAVTGSSTVAWSNSNPTNFTTTAGSGTGAISMTSASAKTFTGGGSTYNCTLNQGGAGTLTINGANTFGDITNTHAGSSTISLGANQTVSDFTLSGTVGNVVTFNSSSSGTRRNISKASETVNVLYLNIVDSNGTGGATWNAFTGNGNIDGGNNLGWNFVLPISGLNMFMLFD